MLIQATTFGVSTLCKSLYMLYSVLYFVVKNRLKILRFRCVYRYCICSWIIFSIGNIVTKHVIGLNPYLGKFGISIKQGRIINVVNKFTVAPKHFHFVPFKLLALYRQRLFQLNILCFIPPFAIGTTFPTCGQFNSFRIFARTLHVARNRKVVKPCCCLFSLVKVSGPFLANEHQFRSLWQVVFHIRVHPFVEIPDGTVHKLHPRRSIAHRLARNRLSKYFLNLIPKVA